MAPQAAMRWYFAPTTSAKGVSLWLASTQERFPVNVDGEGSFSLPAEKLRTGRYRLLATGAHGTVKLRPFALSPGSSRTDFRFGDARLSCEVMLGFEAPATNVFVRKLLQAVGGCHSRRFGIYFSSDHPIRAVSIANWRGQVDILPDRLAWRAPLYDRSIANEARVQVQLQ